MKLRLIQIRDILADSFWFVPFVMALLAGGAALGSVALDHAIGGSWVKDIGWVWSGGPDGARGVLSVVAGSVMTVVSIVFSLTVTTLAQTSSHYGPRVLRNFTSDRFVQFTLGTFISTFVYCLLVLRTVRSVEEAPFVPYLSVNLGVGLALASLAVLIYFIHHISQSIQAENLIAAVGKDFQQVLLYVFPERIGAAATESSPGDSKGHIESGHIESEHIESEHELSWDSSGAVNAPDTGYIQRVDDERLMRLACEHDLVLRLEQRPGDFVIASMPLLRFMPPARATAKIERQLCQCFSLGAHRTPHQDIAYPLQQLVEIAAHALSPGINEPFTALTCIDWLGASLRGVAEREFPAPFRRDEKGRLRVVARPYSFTELVALALDPIRLYGAQNPDVAVRLLVTLAKLAPSVWRDEDRKVLTQHAQQIGLDARGITNQADQQRILRHLDQTLHVLTG